MSTYIFLVQKYKLHPLESELQEMYTALWEL